jgi:hypothetical protein
MQFHPESTARMAASLTPIFARHAPAGSPATDDGRIRQTKIDGAPVRSVTKVICGYPAGGLGGGGGPDPRSDRRAAYVRCSSIMADARRGRISGRRVMSAVTTIISRW